MSSRIERWRQSWGEEALPELLADWYQVPALLLLMGFMLWTRLQSFDNFVRGDEIFFSGNDAYYHFREVNYAVAHWPWTMPFDPWTEFPYGTSADQFGTLFDQIVATAALVVGLGSPSEQTIALTLLVAPAVFGALVAIPVYFLGKRLGGRLGGVFAVFVLALLPGSFFQRSLVGFSDHHVAEVLFQATVILTTMVALTVAERKKPVYEQFLDRDWDGLRTPLLWSALAGVVIGLYLWIWPPAIVVIGILGAFYLVALSIEVVRGRSPEHLAFVGVISLAVVFVMTAVNLDSMSSFGVTSLTPLHLTVIAAVAAGCAFMAVLARIWEERGLNGSYYPAAIGALVVAGVGVVSVVLPRLFGTIVRNALRSFGFGQTDTTLTIREAQAVPFDQLGSFLLGEYGLLFITALAGLLLLAWDCYRRDRYRAELLLLVVWAIFTTSMAMTQVRFNYYLAVVVAVLTVRAFQTIVPLLDLPDSVDGLTDVKGFQVISVLAVVLLVVVPLAPPVAANDVVTGGQGAGPGGSVVAWDEGLDWMEGNTPPEGTYGDTNDPMPYYGTFERTDDFDYPEGAYGVMSWWDYGHWITVEGERIPVANPFQHNAREASAYLQSTDESRANLMLEALPSMGTVSGSLDDQSTEDLEAIVANQSDQHAQEDTRYVAIDDQMAGGKFPAIATWAGPGQEEYFQQRTYQIQDQNATIPATSDRYDQTMLSQLYFQDAAGLSHYRLVHEVDEYSIVGGIIQRQQVRPLTSLPLSGNWDSLAGTAGQLEQAYQADQAVQIGQSAYVYNARVESRVKLYERVEGATLTGTAPNATNGTPVVAIMQLQTHTGRNFTYVQQAETDSDGSFAMTVPYATDDGVSVADGGTNSSVRARGEYTVRTGSDAVGTTAVPEEAIYQGDEIQVELEAVEGGNETTPPGNETAPPSNETGDGQPADSGGQTDSGNESGNETAGSLEADVLGSEAASAAEP